MRKIIIIFIAFLSLGFFACSDISPKKLLAYQLYPLRLTAAYSCCGNEYEVDVEMTSPGIGKVAYTAPVALSGLVFSVSDGEAVLTDGELTLAVPETGVFCDGEVICAMLSLSADKLISTELRKGQNPLSVATFDSDAGKIELILDSGGKPLRLYSIENDILLKNINITAGGTPAT